MTIYLKTLLLQFLIYIYTHTHTHVYSYRLTCFASFFMIYSHVLNIRASLVLFFSLINDFLKSNCHSSNPKLSHPQHQIKMLWPQEVQIASTNHIKLSSFRIANCSGINSGHYMCILRALKTISKSNCCGTIGDDLE